MDNRISRLLGVEHPIVQAPMGWTVRAAALEPLAPGVAATP